MKALGWASGTWVLALVLGLMGVSRATHKSTVLLKNRKLPHEQQVETAISKEPDAATKAKVQAAYGQLSLSFEVNQGQTDPQVRFLSHGSGYTLFLTSSESVLALWNAERRTRNDEFKNPHPSFIDHHSSFSPGTVLCMHLVGANPQPQVVGLDELPGKSHYFIGNDPSKWRTGIPHYAKVKYEGIYPGIDLIYYGNQGQLEYDFIVAPGADPKAINLAFEGLTPSLLAGEACPERSRRGQDRGINRSPLQINDNGDLILQTVGGELRLHKPRIYQEINGVKQPIPGGYMLLEPETQDRQDTETRRYGDTASQNPRVAPSPRHRLQGGRL